MRSPFRVMYVISNSVIDDRESVVNSCGTKNCCNPDHLMLKRQPFNLSINQLAGTAGTASPKD